MSRREVYRLICRMAERDYADVVDGAGFDDESARVYLQDGSFLEVWLHGQEDLMGRYAFHWERRHVDGRVYRHDNTPHASWRGVETFPRHFHFEAESNVVESHMPDDPISASKYFLDFVREYLRKRSSESR